MSKYGIKIKNFEAGSLYGYNLGVRNNLDYTNAMLTNSLFSYFMVEHGLNVWKGESTRDIICIEFNYGTRSYEEEIENLKSPTDNFKYQYLSEEEQELYKLRVIKQLSQREIANKLGVDQSTVSRKLKKLKVEIKKGM